MKINNLYFTAYLRGSLEDCLITEKPITEIAFFKLLESALYKFYGYDDRIKCNRYLLIDIEHNIGLPTWLHRYIEGK